MPDESTKHTVPPDQALRRASEAKIAKGVYDVFLCYKNEDWPTVKSIGNQLKDWGIAPWLEMLIIQARYPAREAHLR